MFAGSKRPSAAVMRGEVSAEDQKLVSVIRVGRNMKAAAGEGSARAHVKPSACHVSAAAHAGFRNDRQTLPSERLQLLDGEVIVVLRVSWSTIA